MSVIKKLAGGLIVSCQDNEETDPLHGSEYMAAFARCAEIGGAVGIRASLPDVPAIKKATDLPVMAHNKVGKAKIRITPTFEAAKQVVEAGADILTMDATRGVRPDGNTESDLIRKIKDELGVPVNADIGTVEDGINAAEAGADMLATTLAGYTTEEPTGETYMGTRDSIVEYTKYMAKGYEKGPDIELVHLLTSKVKIPVVCEARIWTPEQACYALKAGAYAVVVGTAITRPHVITRRFVDVMNKCKLEMHRKL